MDLEEINRMCQQLNLDDSDSPVVWMERQIYAEGKEKLDLFLIGKIKGNKLTKREALETIMNLAWRFPHPVKVETLSIMNVFAFYFENVEDRECVLTRGPWTFER